MLSRVKVRISVGVKIKVPNVCFLMRCYVCKENGSFQIKIIS